jgi:hypothetical protein
MVGEGGSEQGLIPRICSSLFYCLDTVVKTEGMARPVQGFSVTVSYFEMCVALI